jgi:hypothetical protein
LRFVGVASHGFRLVDAVDTGPGCVGGESDGITTVDRRTDKVGPHGDLLPEHAA